MGLSYVQCVSLDGNQHANQFLYHKSHIGICVVNTFAASQLLAFEGREAMQSYYRESILNNPQ